jgi:glycosyltransferase involved in cell wall biosynthesis
MRTLSISIPVFNRFESTIDAFMDVYFDQRVEAVVIVDDASTDGSFEKLRNMTETLPKVKLYRQAINRDCYGNKRDAVAYSPTNYCIVLDSDNRIDKSYLDAIYKQEWRKDTSIMPSFAAPTFDYRAYEGMMIDKGNVAAMMGLPMFDTMLNCMNFFINRDEYLRTWDGTVNPHTADSLYFNYLWFNRGNKMYVSPNMTYQHLIHSGSHYVNNNHLTGNFYAETEQKLKKLK